MAESTVIVKPLFKPSAEFKIDADIYEERSTIVHVQLLSMGPIRIWDTTYLVQNDGTRKKLLQAYNISRYPDWKDVAYGHVFTLVFEGLNKDCEVFDLLEDIPEPGGFQVANIKRNSTDVYNVEYGQP